VIFVTGGTGFVGSALLNRLLRDGYKTSANVRSSVSNIPGGVQSLLIGGITAATDWNAALKGVQVVVHCAARVHVMDDRSLDPLEAYRQVNVDGTLNLANQAAQAGVRRFVFVSSIKVNGEVSRPSQPFTADQVPAPLDPYGISKLEAELGLREIESKTGMEVVIVRPPLVFGPGVKANFASMMRWVVHEIPLPLGAIHNARSMVSLDNLVDLLVTCLEHPAARGQTFLVSDGEDLSTTELLRRTARAMGKKALLLPVPTFFLELSGALLGKRAVVQRLCGSLQVDIKKTKDLLGWSPPVSVDEGLRQTATHFLKMRS
jgi:nucleoside-diphosphate-sugar epimerase